MIQPLKRLVSRRRTSKQHEPNIGGTEANLGSESGEVIADDSKRIHHDGEEAEDLKPQGSDRGGE